MQKVMIVIGAILVAVAVMGTYFSRGAEVAAPPPATALPTAPLLAPTASPLPSAAEVAAMPPAPPPTAPPVPPAQTVAPPVRIVIPAMKVDAAFEYVGLTPEKEMDVPKNPANVAWYKLGPKPGEKGNAIVAGHVDWGGKLGVFWSLKDLKPGDVVTVTAEDGRKFEFVVQWSKWYDWDVGGTALQEIYGQSDRSELTLITCGGTFDRASRNYLDRLVVRAVLR